MKSLFTSMLVAGIVGAMASGAWAAEPNWPQWRGPLGTGVAPQADPPTTWSETQNVKWKVKLPGSGSSTPIIWDRFVFVQAAINTQQAAQGGEAAQRQEPRQPERGKRGGPGPRKGKGGRPGGGNPFGVTQPTQVHQFVLMCLDRETGKTLWQAVAREEVPHEGHHRDHGFSSHSPVTNGRHVYAYFGSRGLHCYDMAGKLVWQKDLGDMRTKNAFGEGSSPALHGDTLVINWDHEGEDFIVALDAATGEERWRQKRDEDTSWSTPLIVEHDGRAQVITAATNKIRSYDLQSGKLLWETGPLTDNVIPTPVAGDGMAYVMSGFRGNYLYAIRLGFEGELGGGSEAIAWRYDKNTPYVPSPLLYGNRLYFISGNSNIITCLDAKTGKPLFETQRLQGLSGIYASPVGAADRVYIVGRNGTTAVIRNADRLEVLATNTLEDPIDASPAAVGKQLFLRGHNHLYCIEEQ